MNVPLLQGIQDPASEPPHALEIICPGAHKVHEEHAMEPLPVAYVPTPHAVHIERPGVGLKVPLLHARHTPALTPPQALET